MSIKQEVAAMVVSNLKMSQRRFNPTIDRTAKSELSLMVRTAKYRNYLAKLRMKS